MIRYDTYDVFNVCGGARVGLWRFEFVSTRRRWRACFDFAWGGGRPLALLKLSTCTLAWAVCCDVTELYSTAFQNLLHHQMISLPSYICNL